MSDRGYMEVEDLEVYQLLCRLHLEVCDLTHRWPSEERYELGSQVRRSSNSSPSQLAEKNDDRHIRNKIEGINRARGEASETVHHLYMAHMKEYISEESFLGYKQRHKQCIRMLNGLERSLERHIPDRDRRWKVKEDRPDYIVEHEPLHTGWPASPEHRTPNTETRRSEPSPTHQETATPCPTC